MAMYPEMTDWMTVPTSRMLNQFTNRANKATWHTNPEDRARWMAFIRAAHEEKVVLPGGVLKDWLRRAAGWPEDQARGLVEEYEVVRKQLAAEPGEKPEG